MNVRIAHISFITACLIKLEKSTQSNNTTQITWRADDMTVFCAVFMAGRSLLDSDMFAFSLIGSSDVRARASGRKPGQAEPI